MTYNPRPRLAVKVTAARPLPRVLTAAEAQAVLDACGHLRDRLLLGMLLDTGIFSRGHPLWRKPILRVCAAQRLME